jgi:hypothetical protein
MRRTAGDALSQQRQGRTGGAPERRKNAQVFPIGGSVALHPEPVTSTANRSAHRCMHSMHPLQERRGDHGHFSSALLDECCTCPAITCLYSITK